MASRRALALPGPIRLTTVRNRLANRSAVAIDAAVRSQAAVAILLVEYEEDTHALLIKRAEREGDPWSGQMAFPGGRREPHELDCIPPRPERLSRRSASTSSVTPSRSAASTTSGPRATGPSIC
jgi:hypothetical protein